MLLTILLFIVILGVIVLVHEMGHFLVAKKTGMHVDEFGFGFPPRIFGIQNVNKSGPGQKKWRLIKGRNEPEDDNKNTIYSVNWIPIGGFVKIKGEQGDKRDDRDSFASKKLWQRTAVLSAGVGMNFVLAFVIIAIAFSIGLPSMLTDTLPESADIQKRQLQIIEVDGESPAAEAGIKMGDIIVSVNSEKLETVTEFQEVSSKSDTEMAITISRGAEEIDIIVTPKSLYDNKGAIGVWLAETGIVRYPWYYSIWMGLKTTVVLTWRILVAFFEIIKNLIVSQQVSADIAGPVGIAVITGQVAKLGFIYILQFIALLSINLAIINFLPFPALDGGRILFLLIEKIRGKPMNQKIEAIIHNIGFMILIGAILLVTFKDIFRII